jgi:hypothetical protein
MIRSQKIRVANRKPDTGNNLPRDCQDVCAGPVSFLSKEPFAEDDDEPGFRFRPLPRRSFPFRGSIVKDEVYTFEQNVLDLAQRPSSLILDATW